MTVVGVAVRPRCDGVQAVVPKECSALVIFGITGDLARKKIFAALYDLAALARLDMPIVGVGRSAWTDERLREVAAEAMRAEHAAAGDINERLVEAVLGKLSYVQGLYDSPDLFQAITRAVSNHRSVLCYLAVPPTVFGDVVKGLAGTNLRRRVRLLVEKPFGSDLASARALFALTAEHFDEEQIFAVDHYLQKESLQNVVVLRFANRLLEPAWNSQHIESVRITMAESFGIDGRAGFFDSNGTLRDVVQNHLLQIVAALAMEPPESSSAEHLNDRRAELLCCVQPLTADDVLFGQYDGYRDVDDVAPNSKTDTFVRAQLAIANDRWRGVRWTIVAGKALDETATEIVVTLRGAVASQAIGRKCVPEQNELRIRLSPKESIVITLQARSDAVSIGTASAEMETTSDYRPDDGLNAYARLFDQARLGDHSQFARRDVVEAAWRIVNDVLTRTTAPAIYKQGTPGPGM